MITDGGPVDRTAVLCWWKHLVEVSALCSQAATPEVAVAVELHVLEHMHVHPCNACPFLKHASVYVRVWICQSHQSVSTGCP